MGHGLEARVCQQLSWTRWTLITVGGYAVQLTAGSSRSNGPARRKAERKAARNPEPPVSKGKRRGDDEEDAPRKRVKEAREEATPRKPPPVEQTQKPKVEKQGPPKEKKKKQELSLPDQDGGAVEDREIEWLEYMLKKEKGKEEDSDGLDGACNT